MLTNDELFQMMADEAAATDGGCKQWVIEDYGPNGYCMVEWPYSQAYQQEPWFDEEAYLDITNQYGDEAYWIPEARIQEREGFDNGILV